MPQILGTYEITVEGSLAGWTPGPIFLLGEAVRVQAGGAIEWGSAPGNSNPTIDSVPASGVNVFNFTFTIPAGMWVSGEWTLAGSGTASGMSVKTPVNNVALSGFPSSGAFSGSATATSNQI